MHDLEFEVLEEQYMRILSETSQTVSEAVVIALTRKDPLIIKKLGFHCDNNGNITLSEALIPCIDSKNIVQTLVTVSLLTWWIQDHPSRLMTLFGHRLIDKYTAKHAITCHKGCDKCCHISVNVFEDELYLIKEYVLKNSLPTYHTKLGACRFLQDKSCLIYEIRPISCRNHITPKGANCKNLDKAPHIIMKETALFISAMINVYELFKIHIE